MTDPAAHMNDLTINPHIVIGDDHPLVAAAIRASLQHAFPQASFSEATTVEDVVSLLSNAERETDLVLLDLNMPGNAGFSGLLLLLASFPDIPIAILSAQAAPETIAKAIRLGASGYIPKTASLVTLSEAVKAILDGEVWVPSGVTQAEQPESEKDIEIAKRLQALTPQQLRILARVVEGKLNKQIAAEMNIAEQTVKVHVSTILRKLDVITRTQAAILVERSGGSSPTQ